MNSEAQQPSLQLGSFFIAGMTHSELSRERNERAERTLGTRAKAPDSELKG